jgi:hypothetical protein
MVRKSRWRAPLIRFKCDHGPHTEEFYLGTCEVIVVDVAVVDAGRKRTAESPLETNSFKSRRIIDYVEKDSNEFKGPENQFPSTSVHLMEAMEIDFHSPETATFGRPRKDIDHLKVQRTTRNCEELKVKLVLAEEETEAHHAKLTMEVDELHLTSLYVVTEGETA